MRWIILCTAWKHSKIPFWCPPTLQNERCVRSHNKALRDSFIFPELAKTRSSRILQGQTMTFSSMVNHINSCLWRWRVGFNWPLQLHSLICHIFLSTLQFDKQDLNWSLPHSKQSTVNSELQVAEGDISYSMCLPTHAILKQQLPVACSSSTAAKMSPKVNNSQPVCFRASSDWAQTRSQPGVSLSYTVAVHCRAALGHLAMYAATSFSRLWAKRWLRKRSWPWGSRRLSRASMRLLLSRTWKGKC